MKLLFIIFVSVNSIIEKTPDFSSYANNMKEAGVRLYTWENIAKQYNSLY